MLATGNGAVPVCALNLLRTVRGEVPYVRTKGIDRELIDISESRSYLLRADAEWVLTSYEPRADVDEVLTEIASDGDATLVARLT